MSTIRLTFEQIASAICQHWQNSLPESVATAFLGMQLATDGLTEWYELSLDPWELPARRDRDPEQARLQLHMRCFVRPGTAMGRVLQLSDYARTAFSQTDVSIRDQTVSDTPVIGIVRFDAGTYRDLSRADRDRGLPPLCHGEWTWTGSVRA